MHRGWSGASVAEFIVPNNKSNSNSKQNRSRPHIYRNEPAYLYATVDPFHPEAQGARLPDESAYPAIPFTSTLRQNLSSNANGAGAIAITPLWSGSTSIQPSVAVTGAGVVDWGTAPVLSSVSQIAAIQSNFQTGRHVGWGVKIVANSAVSATAGTLYIGYYPTDYQNSARPKNLPTTPDQVLALPWSTSLPASELNEDCFIMTARRLDESTLRYRDVSYPNGVPAAGAIEDSDGWGTFVIILVGASTTITTSIAVTACYRDEFTPKASSIVGVGQIYPTNSAEMDRIINVGAKLPVVIREPEMPGVWDMLVSKMAAAAGRYAAPVRDILSLGGQVGSSMVSNWVREAGRKRGW